MQVRVHIGVRQDEPVGLSSGVILFIINIYLSIYS